MPLSCWLVPPDGEADALIRATASAHDLPAFDAHITLLGSVGDAYTVETASAKLAQLAGTGAVPIRFASVLCGEVDGVPAWNQSAAAVAERSDELERLAKLARAAFVGTPEDAPVEWAKPLGEPHMSLAYGSESSLAATLPVPAAFVATEAVLAECTPATLAGVPGWKVVARVSLVPS